VEAVQTMLGNRCPTNQIAICIIFDKTSLANHHVAACPLSDTPRIYQMEELLSLEERSNLEQMNTSHQCRRRADHSGFWNRLHAWWHLPAHVTAVMLFTSLMMLLDQKKFRVHDSRPWSQPGTWTHYSLQQSDVTTMISAGLLATRLLCASWHLLSAWRCAYILLEKDGLSLHQLSSMVSNQVPVKPPIGNKRSSSYPWLTLIIIGLAWPAQLIAPLASGSVSWIPDSIMVQSTNPAEVDVGGTGYPWDWYQMYPNNREVVVQKAASIADAGQILNSGNDNIQNAMASRRLVPSLRRYYNGSHLGDITVPYIKIHALEWSLEAETIPNDIKDAVLDTNSKSLQISKSLNPLQQPILGNAALLKTSQWTGHSQTDDSPHYEYPSAKTSYSGSMYIAVLVVRDVTRSVVPDNGVFGALSPTYQYLQSDNNNYSNWYAIGSVTFEAGVTICTDCQSVAPILAQSRSHGNTEMLPDALVDEVFNLMPEVMLAMATTNITRTSQINRLDNYTISLLARAYQGSWNALNDVVSNATVTIPVTEPFEAVRASISKPRMYAWAAINLLLTLSGTILMITQAQCRRKPVVDAVLAAIMMDASVVRSRDSTGLCNAVKLQGGDKSIGKLRLQRPEGSVWAHDLLGPAATMLRQKTF
jgi:hypothetical protein